MFGPLQITWRKPMCFQGRGPFFTTTSNALCTHLVPLPRWNFKSSFFLCLADVGSMAYPQTEMANVISMPFIPCQCITWGDLAISQLWRNLTTVEKPMRFQTPNLGGVGLGVYRGFVSLTVLRNSIRLKSALLNLLRAAAGCQDHRWDFGDSPVINPIFCEVLVPTSANPNTPFSAPEISILSEAGMPTCDQRPVPVDCLFNHLPSLLHRRRPMSGLTVAAKRVCPENCRWRPCVRSFQGLSCIDCRARPFTSASCKSPSKTTWVPPARILKDVPCCRQFQISAPHWDPPFAPNDMFWTACWFFWSSLLKTQGASSSSRKIHEKS